MTLQLERNSDSTDIFDINKLSFPPFAMSRALSKPLSEYRQPHLLSPTSARQKELSGEVVG